MANELALALAAGLQGFVGGRNQKLAAQAEKEKQNKEYQLALMKSLGELVDNGIVDPVQANALIGAAIPQLAQERKSVVPAAVQAKDLPVAAPQITTPSLRPTALNQTQYNENLGKEALARFAGTQVPDRFRELGQAPSGTVLPAELRMSGALPDASALISTTKTERTAPQLFREKPKEEKPLLKSASDLGSFVGTLIDRDVSNEDIQRTVKETVGVDISLPSIDVFRQKRLGKLEQDIASGAALEKERLSSDKYNQARTENELLENRLKKEKSENDRVDPSIYSAWVRSNAELSSANRSELSNIDKQIADARKASTNIVPEVAAQAKQTLVGLQRQRANAELDKLKLDIKSKFLEKQVKNLPTTVTDAQKDFVRNRVDKTLRDAGYSEDEIVEMTENFIAEVYPEAQVAAPTSGTTGKKSIGWK